MDSSNQSESSRFKLPPRAAILGAVAAFITAGAVSWFTPDGNIVVTLAPALVVGLTVFGLALRRFRRGKSEHSNSE